MLSLYGKLPTAGDFLTIQVPKPLLRPIEDWLALSVTASKQSVEDDWQEKFDAAPGWCFWIGEAVHGRRIAGVLRMSRDRVGRRFPVMLFASNTVAEDMPEAPVIEADQTLYRGLMEELGYLTDQLPDSISERLKSAGQIAPEGAAPTAGIGNRSFWAIAKAEGNEAWVQLTEEAAGADHAQTTAERSYWWTPDGASGRSALFATNGMPEPDVFAWFVTGLGVPSCEDEGQSD